MNKLSRNLTMFLKHLRLKLNSSFLLRSEAKIRMKAVTKWDDVVAVDVDGDWDCHGLSDQAMPSLAAYSHRHDVLFQSALS